MYSKPITRIEAQDNIARSDRAKALTAIHIAAMDYLLDEAGLPLRVSKEEAYRIMAAKDNLEKGGYFGVHRTKLFKRNAVIECADAGHGELRVTVVMIPTRKTEDFLNHYGGFGSGFGRYKGQRYGQAVTSFWFKRQKEPYIMGDGKGFDSYISEELKRVLISITKFPSGYSKSGWKKSKYLSPERYSVGGPVIM